MNVQVPQVQPELLGAGLIEALLRLGEALDDEELLLEELELLLLDELEELEELDEDEELDELLLDEELEDELLDELEELEQQQRPTPMRNRLAMS